MNDIRYTLSRIELLEDENDSVVSEIQQMVDTNQWLKGTTVSANELISTPKFVLLFSQDSADHIKERHSNAAKPGSLFDSGVDLKHLAQTIMQEPPSERSNSRVKWLEANAGSVIGSMGVAHANPEKVAQMTDYQMPDGQKETVKITQGERKPTNQVNLITSELGTLSDGRTALSLITMFPGSNTVDGKSIPMNRADFARQGFYFVVSENTVTESKLLERLRLIENQEGTR